MKPGRLIVVLLLACASLTSQRADLLEVYRMAQKNDPTFEASRYRYEAALEKIPEARAGLLPVVNLNGSDTVSSAASQFSNTPLVNREVRAWTWTLQLTQPLFRAQNYFAYGESKSQVEAARAQYAKDEQELILRVTEAYFNLLVAQESIRVTEAQGKAAQEQMELVRHGFEAGTNAITDVHEAKARAELAQARTIASFNEFEAMRAELDKVVGQSPDMLEALPPSVSLPLPQPDDVHTWVDMARENNPSVLATKAAYEAGQASVNKNRAEYLPTVDLVTSRGQNYSSGILSTPSDFATHARTSQIGVQLSIPLYAGGSTRSRVTEAIAGMNRAKAELEIARRQSVTDARQAYSAVINGQAQIKALESAVESSNSAVRGNKVGYQLGIHMNIDVLNAEQQLYTTQRDLLKARYDTLLQGFKLKAAVGLLSADDVSAINKLLKSSR